MKKVLSIFLIALFFLVACNGGNKPVTKVEPVTKTFVSENHGPIAIFPTYEYLGMKESFEGKSNREYHLWENKFDGKYILIIQIIPKEGTFPSDLVWNSTQGSLYVKGMRAAYNSIAARTYKIMKQLGAEFPPCFILAQEVHVSPKEAIFRVLIVPDKMCTEEYEPVMEELDRVAVIKPLG